MKNLRGTYIFQLNSSTKKTSSNTTQQQYLFSYIPLLLGLLKGKSATFDSMYLLRPIILRMLQNKPSFFFVILQVVRIQSNIFQTVLIKEDGTRVKGKSNVKWPTNITLHFCRSVSLAINLVKIRECLLRAFLKSKAPVTSDN